MFRDVAANEEVVTVLTFVPRRAGSTMLLVRSVRKKGVRVNILILDLRYTDMKHTLIMNMFRFNSVDLLDVNGTLAIRILP